MIKPGNKDSSLKTGSSYFSGLYINLKYISIKYQLSKSISFTASSDHESSFKFPAPAGLEHSIASQLT
jgi:hypothetical protein